ncbi:hypothetical protein [Magnetospirillum sp. UT-4]|uniref:hypothetical protein n=1 Tax=Magnetospirillum sp. UT-4 TaxID=2681467 RepID=UPI001381BD71|nr:hypothetical protein [Magnetospirillum sp. UT-4]CAA7611599.1 conserved hypothetical protein [Magnetospirillum sp. UT-4]
MVAATIRLMPHHDANWRARLEEARTRQAELLAREGMLTAAEQDELLALREAVDRAFNARFRTTAEYRDFYFAQARELLEAEGIDMPLPQVADDATVEEIDRVLGMVWQAVEVTNSETF